MNVFRAFVRVAANILEHPAFARKAIARRGVVFAMAALALPAVAVAEPVAKGIPVGGERVSLFEARGVPVDATGGSTTEARDKAFTDGRVAALRVVLERLTGADDHARLPQPVPSAVIEMVREFSVANERSSAVRYLANLNVRFDGDAVRRLLRGAQIQFNEAVSRPMMVLPIYRASISAGPTLWDPANPWRLAFTRLTNVDGLVPLILPLGDAVDTELTIDQIMARDHVALAKLAVRYGAGGVVVASAVGGSEGVTVSITEVRGIAPPTETSAMAAAVPDLAPEALMDAAAAATSKALSDSWKRQSRLGVRDQMSITALATLRGLKDWIEIRTALKSVPAVDRIELQAMTRDRAQVGLRYRGDATMFALALAQQGLVAAQQGNIWILSLPAESVQ